MIGTATGNVDLAGNLDGDDTGDSDISATSTSGNADSNAAATGDVTGLQNITVSVINLSSTGTLVDKDLGQTPKLCTKDINVTRS